MCSRYRNIACSRYSNSVCVCMCVCVCVCNLEQKALSFPFSVISKTANMLKLNIKDHPHQNSLYLHHTHMFFYINFKQALK